MEYIFVVVLIIIGIASGIGKLAKGQEDVTTGEPTEPTLQPNPRAQKLSNKKQPKSKVTTTDKSSQLNTNYSSRLTDVGSAEHAYDTLEEIGAETNSDNVEQSSIVDFDILYADDNGDMDVGSIATAIVLGEVLGKPKGRR